MNENNSTTQAKTKATLTPHDTYFLRQMCAGIPTEIGIFQSDFGRELARILEISSNGNGSRGEALEQELKDARSLLEDALVGIEKFTGFLERTDNDLFVHVSGMLMVLHDSIDEQFTLQGGRLNMPPGEAEEIFSRRYTQEGA